MWDEDVAEEKFDPMALVALKTDVTKALGGRTRLVRQLLRDAENGHLQLLKAIAAKDRARRAEEEQAYAEEEARLRAAAEARAAARAEAKAHARAARRNKIGGGGHDAESVAASSSTVGSLPMGGGNSGVLPGHRVGISAAAAKEKLLRFGDFDLDELKDEVGRNFLHAAAAAGHAKACAVAVKQGGMAINKKTIYGFTPLMLAASWGREVRE